MYGMVSSQITRSPSSSSGPNRSLHRISEATTCGRIDSRPPKSVYRRMVNLFKQAWTGVKYALDAELEDLESESNRYKPKGLKALCRSTKFNREELQLMYRGYKQVCPSGIVTEETFRDIYAKFFPHGDSSKYAHYVFNCFDLEQNGKITFEDFAVGLSILLRGTLEEKLRWTFNLYDINRDGSITKEEMLNIVTSIYGLLGKSIEPQIDNDTAKNHVDRVFQKLDMNQDGVVTIDEFVEFCSNDNSIHKAMCMFDGL